MADETVQSGSLATLPTPGSEPATPPTPATQTGTSTPTPATTSKVDAPAKSDAAPSQAKEVEARSDAAVDAPKEASTELSPEEKTRREEQSFKDKFYAQEQKVIELEREIQKQKVTQLTGEQSRELSTLQTTVAQQEEAYADLYAQYQEAVQNEDYQAAQRLYNNALTVYQGKELLKSQLDQKARYYQSQTQELRKTEFFKAIDTDLKEEGLTREDLLKIKPNLDWTNPFEYSRAKTGAVKAQHEAEKKNLKAEKEEAEKKAREKWTDTSPGAVADKPGGGGIGEPLSIKAGNTSKFLEKAFSGK